MKQIVKQILKQAMKFAAGSTAVAGNAVSMIPDDAVKKRNRAPPTLQFGTLAYIPAAAGMSYLFGTIAPGVLL